MAARTCTRVELTFPPSLAVRVLQVASVQGMAGSGSEREHVIGVGHGRTLAACVDHLPRTPAPGTTFVSLLGGLTRKFAANPHDVIHRLAERTGAQAYVMPVPMFANTLEDRAVLLGQKGVGEVRDLARAADLLLLWPGIGTHPAGGLARRHRHDRAGGDGGDRARRRGGRAARALLRRGRPGVRDGALVSLARARTRRARRPAHRGRRRGKGKGPGGAGGAREPGAKRGLITDERTARTLL